SVWPGDPGGGAFGRDHAADGAGYAEPVEVLAGGRAEGQVRDRRADAGRVDVPGAAVDAGLDQLDRGRGAVAGHHLDLAEPAGLAQRLDRAEQRLVVERHQPVQVVEVGQQVGG